MVERRVDYRLSKEQKCVQVTFPDLRIIVLSEGYQRSAHNSDSASQNLQFRANTFSTRRIARFACD